MRLLARVVPVFLLLGLLPASSALAQQWKWDFGINAGYALYSSVLGEDETGQADDTPFAEVGWENGFLFGTQLGYWFGPKLGLRANLRYADRPLSGSDAPETSQDFITSTNLWGATLDLLYRFTTPREEYLGMEVHPYFALGLGGKWINPAEDQFECSFGGETDSCGPFVTPGNRAWALQEDASIAGLIGLGADWRISRSFALRTEISDQIYKPQINRATIPASGNVWTLQSDENESKTVHEIAFQLGLQFLFGIAAPPAPVAVAPPPPPPVAPPPPPPPPREESITVCIVDPTAPGGIRMETATLVESRDTFLMVAGTRRPIRDAVGNVMVASNADWFVRGQPLVMTVGTERVEFATIGTSRVIDAQDIAFLGTVNGVPVYADRDEVQDVIEELNELNRARAGTDLGKLLEENRDLRQDLEDVKVVYVPLYSTGCVFQGVQRQERVIKGGK